MALTALMEQVAMVVAEVSVAMAAPVLTERLQLRAETVGPEVRLGVVAREA